MNSKWKNTIYAVTMVWRASNKAISVTILSRKIIHLVAVEGNRPTRILSFLDTDSNQAPHRRGFFVGGIFFFMR